MSISKADSNSKLHTLYREYRQSIWLDYIDRNMLWHGGLKALLEEGVRGVTSNPSIFYKAMAHSSECDEAIHSLLGKDPAIDDESLYMALAIQDVQAAADLFLPLYEHSHGQDGFVSLEVSPYLAEDAEATVRAAHQLRSVVDRPNLMVKVPATDAGLIAIEQLIADGININVTLLFSVARYKAVTDAWLKGLSQNSQPGNLSSVASFFVSRVDSKLDELLEKSDEQAVKELQGRIAIANAKLAYQHFKEVIASPGFNAQQRRGARPQRPLWASTGTKNPAYSDVLYVEQLIGPDTVNTLPPETLAAFQSHGRLHSSLEQGVDEAQRVLDVLPANGIDMADISRQLEQEGLRKFQESHDQLLRLMKDKRDLFSG